MAQQETRRKVTRPASKKRRRAKSASHASGSAKSTSVARRGETRHTHVCPHQRHSKLVSACRILKRSASGERVMALNLEEGKKITYKNDQILELKKRAQVAIGDSALLSCQTQGAGCSYAKKSYLKCLVADQFDDEYVINCNGQELQVTQRQLHFSQKVSSQVAQAE